MWMQILNYLLMMNIVIERIKPTSDYAIDLCGYNLEKEVITTWDYFHTHSASSIEIMI